MGQGGASYCLRGRVHRNGYDKSLYFLESVYHAKLLTADFGGLIGKKTQKTMKKLVIAALALCMGFVTATAQITTGKSSAQVVRTGNRAEAGNFGLYLGATADMFKDLVSVGDAELKALPLINFKYMVNDNVEARLGLEWWTVANGSNTKGETPEGDDFKAKAKTKSTNKYFYPGIAYHFSNSNLLDVYVGAELPIGLESNIEKESGDYDGDDYKEKSVDRSFNVGLGGFVGLQAYVANLPLAIGVEYGISSKKTISSSKFVTDEEQEYEVPRKKLNTWNVGHQARLTLTYFFKM